MAKNILSLNHKKALEFFMSTSNYTTLETPEYIDMSSLLKNVRKNLGSTEFKHCLKSDPRYIKNLNYSLYVNKDGKQAIRPITLVNPYIYYFFVREICTKDNWNFIKFWFHNMQIPTITVCSFPVIAEKSEAFHKATTVLNWWNNFEQGSLNLSLEYPYMFVSDIRNCYGTIKPEIIKEALNYVSDKNNTVTIDESSKTKIETPVNKNFMDLLRLFQGDLIIGLPQGNALSDFLAEIVLAYADMLFYKAIIQQGLNCKYKVLRYRDDYRIFCNDLEGLKQISYVLQNVLLQLNFDLNSQKTKYSDDLITNSIKGDKLAYIYNTPIFNKKGCDFDGIQKHLLFIRQFGKQYPNSGQLKTLLSDLSVRLDQKINPDDFPTTSIEEDLLDQLDEDFDSIQEDIKKAESQEENIFKKLKVFPTPKYNVIKEDFRPIIAIATQISIENVTCCHYALRVISQLLAICNNKQKKEITALIVKRILDLPNNEYLQIWLQAMTYLMDKKRKDSPYTNRICKIVMGANIELWNTEWLKEDLTKGIPQSCICNKNKLSKAKSIIRFKERDSYLETSKVIYKL